ATGSGALGRSRVSCEVVSDRLRPARRLKTELREDRVNPSLVTPSHARARRGAAVEKDVERATERRGMEVRRRDRDRTILERDPRPQFTLGLLLPLERGLDAEIIREEHVVGVLERAVEPPILRPLDEQRIGLD